MKKLVCLMLIAVMLLTAGCGNNDSANTTPGGESKQTESTTAKETTQGTEAPEPVTTPEQTTEKAKVSGDLPRVGDTITFGSYPQEADGTVKPIEWQVLAVEDGKALLISRYGLDAKPYNEEYTSVTWETCTLRTWLNEDFYKEAFSEDEKSKIQLTKVENKDNGNYGTPGGNETEDKVFLLSLDEVKEYFTSDEERWCYATEWAVEQGAWVSSSTGYEGACVWWLRSPGYGSKGVANVVSNGDVRSHGNDVNDGFIAVRPAFWYNP